MSRVAIVSLGRDAAFGEVRRVASWRVLFEAAGAQVEEVRLTAGPRLDTHFGGIAAVATGRATPERLAWSGKHLRDELARIDPAVVIVVSARAFDPAPLAGPWTIALDLVDSLSRSYRDRSAIVPNLISRLEFRSLAGAHARFERKLGSAPGLRIAAGWSDAQILDAHWVPNVVDPALQPVVGAVPDRDVLFFGTLRYPPNIDALENLARIWSIVLQARPGTTALVAGSSPPARVRELCDDNGWELVADFPDLAGIAGRARVAVSPLTRTAGIQNKVLDAACLGVPQVVTSAALAGFAPGFPLEPRSGHEGFAAEVVRLLDYPEVAASHAAAATQHVRANYSVAAWVHWAGKLLAGNARSGLNEPPRAVAAV